MPRSTMPRLPRLDVRVTQKQIDTAIPRNSGHCMISDAVKVCFSEEFGRTPIGVSTDLQTIRLTDRDKGVRYIYLTPPVGQRALLQFDQGITPTEFRMRLKNGQVVRSTSRQSPSTEDKPARTEKQNQHTKKLVEKRRKLARQRAALNGPAKLHVSNDGGNNAGNTRVTIGGKAPPRAVLTGNRRQFGIRAAGVLDGPTQ